MKKYKVITNLFRDFEYGDIIRQSSMFPEWYYKDDHLWSDKTRLPAKFVEDKDYSEYFKKLRCQHSYEVVTDIFPDFPNGSVVFQCDDGNFRIDENDNAYLPTETVRDEQYCRKLSTCDCTCQATNIKSIH